MPNLITENVTSFRNPETLADLVSGLKSKVTRDSVMEPGFLSSLLAKKGTPIDYDNLVSLIGGRLRQAVVDPVRGYGEAVHKGMTGQPLTLGDLAAITELNMDVGVGGGFLSGLRHGVRPNMLRSVPGFKGSDVPKKTYYHGTGQQFKDFKDGVNYFTTNKGAAARYSEGYKEGGRIVKAQLNIKNVATENAIRSAAIDMGMKTSDIETYELLWDDSLIKKLKDEGFDGAEFVDDLNGRFKTTAVFDNSAINQIRGQKID